MKPKRVLVAGASGAVGFAVVRLLRERGLEVRALCKSRESADYFASVAAQLP